MAEIKKFMDQAGVGILWGQVTEKVESEATRAKAAEEANAKKIASLETSVAEHEASLAILEGGEDVEGSVLHTAKVAAADEMAAFIAGADEKYDTLKEISDWILNDTTNSTEIINDVAELKDLVGETKVSEQIEEAVEKSEAKSAALYEEQKYEVSSSPVGTVVSYKNNEIRVMCPADTEWEHQASGENADPNSYYIGFKAYAPANAVSFKEDTKETVEDERIFYFENNDFAGIDSYGRKYSIVWLPVAKFDSATSTWSYYGSQSTKEKIIGFFYSVEWYDADGVMIDTDSIRINLTNESCHTYLTPYYVSIAEARAKAYADSIAAEALTEEEILEAIRNASV